MPTLLFSRPRKKRAAVPSFPLVWFGLAAVALLLLCPAEAFPSVDITLAWDANTEPDLAGYRIFVRAEGESYDYLSPDWEGTDTTCTIYGLADGTNYYFVARAFDTSNNESGDSDEVFYEAVVNDPPVADAGPDQTVGEAEMVTLDGTNSSDADGTIVSYDWVQIGGTTVSLSDPFSETPWFTAPFVGASGEALTFELSVTDDGGLSDTDTVIVNVSNVNLAPTADAGPDQTVGEADGVTLDGTNSTDPDGTIVGYAWTQTGGVSVSLSDPLSAQPSFTAPNVGPGGASLNFQLTVTDDEGLQSSDSCIVNVSWVNLAPTADAGSDLTVGEGELVVLDGSGSTDPDDGIASYLWNQTAGTSVTLSDPNSAVPEFTAPGVGPSGASLTFQLTVTDDGGLQSTDSCTVSVSWIDDVPPAPPGGFQVADVQ